MWRGVRATGRDRWDTHATVQMYPVRDDRRIGFSEGHDERLGKGECVWAAEQQTRVAIKLLDREVSEKEAHVQRFFNEARAVSRIPHAGIVQDLRRRVR